MIIEWSIRDEKAFISTVYTIKENVFLLISMV